MGNNETWYAATGAEPPGQSTPASDPLDLWEDYNAQQWDKGHDEAALPKGPRLPEGTSNPGGAAST